MRIDIEPTPELYDAPVNGVTVPVRIWRGHTDNGASVEAYVLAVTPDTADDQAKLKAALPSFMVPARQMYQIADHGQEAADGPGLLPERGWD